MDTEKRRIEIQKILEKSDGPVTASFLAKKFSVSRQIIVGDIALLRASGYDIESTSRGYLLAQDAYPFIGTLPACHDSACIEDELLTIVDYGGCCLDVVIDHALYGELCGKLNIASRYDVSCFIEKLQSDTSPLSLLSGGVHIHHIGCPSERIYHLIFETLKEKGYIAD